ncbi:YjgN family protein [Ramlibacter sp. WS9]|uniref:YjgN family protein n=1 Tax=Ramlibacter sp. WS9 TaxID=1882741 RepID=UPI001143923C|nr:YjgN family protein [Ramlibacter sp. WS9]ROZ63916.1 DUF898 domain-containing protein [Ramlibacter sp. WS9]
MQTDSSPVGAAARRAGPSAYRIDTNDDIEPFALEFLGTGGEFFRVWIVNLLLNIVTLGFYTPFARRRTAQYFYSHTLVAGSPLEFIAQQRKMVFGFLLLAAIYIAFQVAAETGQDAAVSILMVAGALLAPYLWASAMRFRLGATRWRGVRLQFAASWGEVYKASWPVFVTALVWILVSTVFTYLLGDIPEDQPDALLFAAVPLWAWLLVPAALVTTFLCIIRLEFNYKSLLVSRAYIGAQAGRWKPVYKDFVRIWLATLGVFLLGALALAAVTAVLVGGSIFAADGGKSAGFGAVLAVIAAVFGFLIGLVFASAPARAYRQARMFQLVWNNVGVSKIARFKCRLRTRRFVLLRVKNMVLTLLTLGFYRPFAMISEYRMKAESVTLHVKGGLDQLVGQLVGQQDGIGDALADAVGLDLVG